MRDLILPPSYNQRADKMWNIISVSYDFEGKSVIDLGCGHGDMMLRAYQAGASKVIGVENNEETYWLTREKVKAYDDISMVLWDIENISGDYRKDKVYHSDVIFCFSVLPYLNSPSKILSWIKGHCEVAFLEVQYAGDGPGFKHITDDLDMHDWLRDIGWKNIEAIGRTHTRIRPAWRTIWRCE